MKKYLILGSNVALGVYVPALMLKKNIESAGDRADFVYLEELYQGKSEELQKNRKNFHENFRLAKLCYKLPTKNADTVDEALMEAFFERAESEQYDLILTFSGFWVGIINELARRCPYYVGKLAAVHMDSGYSLSWKNMDISGIREFWPFSLNENRVNYSLDDFYVNENRSRRILVHGGGWGIGQYKEKIDILNELGYSLDIVIYYEDEVPGVEGKNRYFLLDPSWKPDEEKKEFPRLLKYEAGSFTTFLDNSGRTNPVLSLAASADAILSKPGGGTISDSIITSTPILFSEELSTYEKRNEELWTSLGYGMNFKDFAESGNRDELLLEMRGRLSELNGKIRPLGNMIREMT